MEGSVHKKLGGDRTRMADPTGQMDIMEQLHCASLVLYIITTIIINNKFFLLLF